MKPIDSKGIILKVGEYVKIAWDRDEDGPFQEYRGILIGERRGFFVLLEEQSKKEIVFRPSSLAMFEVINEDDNRS
jgi:hypothetical protein